MDLLSLFFPTLSLIVGLLAVFLLASLVVGVFVCARWLRGDDSWNLPAKMRQRLDLSRARWNVLLVDLVGFLFIFLGLMILPWNDSVGLESISIGITIIVIERLLSLKSSAAEEEELQLRTRSRLLSGDRKSAVESLLLAHRKGWFADGSMEDLNLAGIDLSEARLRGIMLVQAHLPNARLQRADLDHANLSHATLSGANLNGALLQRAQLMQANLIASDLREANLAQADLSDAVLTGADLRSAILRMTSLQRADLRQANLMGAILGNRETSMESWLRNFRGAKYDARTRLPDELEAVKSVMEFANESIPETTLEEYKRLRVRVNQEDVD